MNYCLLAVFDGMHSLLPKAKQDPWAQTHQPIAGVVQPVHQLADHILDLPPGPGWVNGALERCSAGMKWLCISGSKHC